MNRPVGGWVVVDGYGWDVGWVGLGWVGANKIDGHNTSSLFEDWPPIQVSSPLAGLNFRVGNSRHVLVSTCKFRISSLCSTRQIFLFSLLSSSIYNIILSWTRSCHCCVVSQASRSRRLSLLVRNLWRSSLAKGPYGIERDLPTFCIFKVVFYWDQPGWVGWGQKLPYVCESYTITNTPSQLRCTNRNGYLFNSPIHFRI